MEKGYLWEKGSFINSSLLKIEQDKDAKPVKSSSDLEKNKQKPMNTPRLLQRSKKIQKKSVILMRKLVPSKSDQMKLLKHANLSAKQTVMRKSKPSKSDQNKFEHEGIIAKQTEKNFTENRKNEKIRINEVTEEKKQQKLTFDKTIESLKKKCKMYKDINPWANEKSATEQQKQGIKNIEKMQKNRENEMFEQQTSNSKILNTKEFPKKCPQLEFSKIKFDLKFLPEKTRWTDAKPKKRIQDKSMLTYYIIYYLSNLYCDRKQKYLADRVIQQYLVDFQGRKDNQKSDSSSQDDYIPLISVDQFNVLHHLNFESRSKNMYTVLKIYKDFFDANYYHKSLDKKLADAYNVSADREQTQLDKNLLRIDDMPSESDKRRIVTIKVLENLCYAHTLIRKMPEESDKSEVTDLKNQKPMLQKLNECDRYFLWVTDEYYDYILTGWPMFVINRLVYLDNEQFEKMDEYYADPEEIGEFLMRSTSHYWNYTKTQTKPQKSLIKSTKLFEFQNEEQADKIRKFLLSNPKLVREKRGILNKKLLLEHYEKQKNQVRITQEILDENPELKVDDYIKASVTNEIRHNEDWYSNQFTSVNDFIKKAILFHQNIDLLDKSTYKFIYKSDFEIHDYKLINIKISKLLANNVMIVSKTSIGQTEKKIYFAYDIVFTLNLYTAEIYSLNQEIFSDVGIINHPQLSKLVQSLHDKAKQSNISDAVFKNILVYIYDLLFVINTNKLGLTPINLQESVTHSLQHWMFNRVINSLEFYAIYNYDPFPEWKKLPQEMDNLFTSDAMEICKSLMNNICNFNELEEIPLSNLQKFKKEKTQKSNRILQTGSWGDQQNKVRQLVAKLYNKNNVDELRYCLF